MGSWVVPQLEAKMKTGERVPLKKGRGGSGKGLTRTMWASWAGCPEGRTEGSQVLMTTHAGYQ